MTTALTATHLRKDVYRILDRILESGEAQEIVRKGRKLAIVPLEPKRRWLERRPKRRILNCTFEELVATSWEQAWDPDS